MGLDHACLGDLASHFVGWDVCNGLVGPENPGQN